MSRSTFKILFYVNKSKEKQGIVPVMGRVTINGTQSQFCCKKSIPLDMWDVKRNVLKGFRVPVGDQFITVYPNLNCSVKDTKNQDGTVKEAATAKMVTASKGKSRLGASVSINFSKQFAMEVSWQKVDETGAAIEEEDITDGGTTPGGGGETGGGDNPGELEG